MIRVSEIRLGLDVRDHINMLMGLSMHGLALIGSL
jgi:hypothetical protein